MTAPARLLALRLQGFKSFGERTLVEFGPGISAVVGPNGSGKSNLADALRWALGEQGRALRLRKSEDVIFAGSEKRSALGMADVTLVFNNVDRLLPIDFETVELGRRLFRSGENDYLLNKQRVRLKDLVELLDAAHLADNAFLFIGQGMVDQALALRPEERRPLFEEVAGVRRHERRKAKAEEQLEEAEVNLARVEDVLAELRPQARRLAAQAEQQVSRQTAGREYGRAIIVLARSRWHEGATRALEAERALRSGRTEAETALGALREAEERASQIARDLASRADLEAERRGAHERARDALTELSLRDARASSEVEAIRRDRERLAGEFAVAAADLELQRRELSVPVPARDLALAGSLTEAERDLAEALEEIGAVRAAGQARGEALAALRRVEAARAAELETVRRRLAEAERQAAAERAAADEAATRLTRAEAAAEGPRGALTAASRAEAAAVAAREKARASLEEREGARQAAAERAAAMASRAAGLRGRLDVLAARLAEEEARGIARAARKAGGRPLSDGLEIEAGFRVAVEAALGDAIRGYVVGGETALELGSQRGTLVLEGGRIAAARGTTAGSATSAAATTRATAGATAGAAASAASAAADEVAAEAAARGGGRLVDAIRTDPTGEATRLLARVVWVPDLAEALTLQASLPIGWLAVTRDGAVLAASGVLTLGRSESLLERKAELERLKDEVTRLEAESAAVAGQAEQAAGGAAAARAALDAARETERKATTARHQAEEAERRTVRDMEAATREAQWRGSQATRVEAERDRLADVAARTAAATEQAAREAATNAQGSDDRIDQSRVLREWEERAAVLRARRDQLAAEDAALEAVRRDVEARRARAGAAANLDEERIKRLESETAGFADREVRVGAERERLGEDLAAAKLREAALRTELEELWQASALARATLTEAETAARNARERLRAAQDRVRGAEMIEVESRLALDGIREQVLVELAGLGELGARLLRYEADPALAEADEAAGAGHPAADEEEESAESLEELLAGASKAWESGSSVEAPTQGRLASLRRRFHELGAPNPFASEEYEALKARLAALEAQRSDLLTAIDKTRALIEQLNSMISIQFRSTFKALETAFDARFRQLFGGGFARLSLTEPDDLAATGIEIVARPPGKRAQPLSMLSGGERALTAVALLFAMLEVHPVPFCVLDEVDAALDEANVGRFAEAVRTLADQTQFIVITHNRGTIENADALYGVTVGEDAVSRVVSLKLEEARELAEQVTRKNAAATAG